MAGRWTVAAGVLLALAAPAAAQMGFSDTYTLLKAVRERDVATAQRILADPSSTALNARDQQSGEGALHIVVRRRDLPWLNFLIARRPRIDLESNDGMTALALASQIGWYDGVQRLLAAGARVNAGNRRGETPLMFAVQRIDVPLVRLLLQQGADPNVTDNTAGLSAIDYAARDPRAAQILRMLREAPRQRAGQMGPTR